MGTRLTIMCPNCYALYRLFGAGNISVGTLDGVECDLMVVPAIHIQCNHCKFDGTTIKLDNGIAECVSLVNKLGYPTEMSCDGHTDERDPGTGLYRTYIKLREGVAQFQTAQGWNWRGQFLESYNAAEEYRDAAIARLQDYLLGWYNYAISTR